MPILISLCMVISGVCILRCAPGPSYGVWLVLLPFCCRGRLSLSSLWVVSVQLPGISLGHFLLLCVSVVTARNCEGPPKAHYIEPLQAMQRHCARAGSYYFEPGKISQF